LRRAKLIEGRKPNFHVPAIVAAATDHKAEYIRTRTQHDTHYQRLILNYLEKHGSASRKEVDDLLWKIHKIANLLSNLRRAGKIKNHGSNKAAEWRIAE